MQFDTFALIVFLFCLSSRMMTAWQLTLLILR